MKNILLVLMCILLLSGCGDDGTNELAYDPIDDSGNQDFGNNPPSILLVGQSEITVTNGNAYTEFGATCIDTLDGVISVEDPLFTPPLNTSVNGLYTATYTCTDTDSLTDVITRTVLVSDYEVTLLFEETFDDQPDWIATARCRYFGDAGCANNPLDWDMVYYGESWSLPDNEPVGQISGDVFRGDSGKSLIMTDESRGTKSQWGSDLQLVKTFQNELFEVYAEYWIKFQDNYQTVGPESSWVAKIFRAHHSRVVAENLQGVTAFKTNEFSEFVFFFDLKINHAFHALRCNPEYKCGSYKESYNIKYPDNANVHDIIMDGEWHKMGWYMKVNSAPGVGDGESHFWLDDQLVSSVINTPFVMSGGNYVGINFISISGNQNSVWAPESEFAEQWYAIDDFKIYDGLPAGLSTK